MILNERQLRLLCNAVQNYYESSDFEITDEEGYNYYISAGKYLFGIEDALFIDCVRASSTSKLFNVYFRELIPKDENDLPIVIYTIDAKAGEVIYNIFEDEEKQDIAMKIKETVL